MVEKRTTTSLSREPSITPTWISTAPSFSVTEYEVLRKPMTTSVKLVNETVK